MHKQQNVFAAAVAAGLNITETRDLARIVSVAHVESDVWAGCRVFRKCVGPDLAPLLSGCHFADHVDAVTGEIPDLGALRDDAQAWLESQGG